MKFWPKRSGARGAAGRALAVAVWLGTSTAAATTRHVATSGADAGNDCTNASAPCATIGHGISLMAGGDELVVGDGTYAEPIEDMPSGSAAAYTTIRAEHDWGVLIDGTAFPDNYVNGIQVSSKSYVTVRGFRVRMNQDHANDTPVAVPYSDHVKIIRCGAGYGPTHGNASTFTVGPSSSYVLVEESYAFGGSRYQYVVYQSDHVVVRRSVARSDSWSDVLQCAGFTNYDSIYTTWQNDIVLDSDTANCTGRLYGGFWNENKTDTAPDTSETLAGDIVLNVQAFYAGDLDWAIPGTRSLSDVIIWGSSGGYYADQGDGVAANVVAKQLTIGGITGTYDGPNGGAAHGTGFSVYGNVSNQLTSSLLVGCQSLGVADYTSSDYNAFSGNGNDYGGAHPATAGAHDLSAVNGNAVDALAKSLLYLPRIESGSPLAKAGPSGGRIGAEVLSKIGESGTLWGDPGWDTLTDEPLWPFPNEDQIRADMAAYSGPGGAGVRGFTAGTSLDGTQQTLTKYVWEYLGHRIPSDVYGLHVAVSSLPDGVVGVPYHATIAVGGGVAPYAWSIAGALPAGLSLDPATGVVAGKPREVGTSNFTVTVSDAETPAKQSTKPLSIRIALSATGSGGSGNGGGDAGGGGDGGGCGCVVGEAPRRGAPLALALFGLVLAFGWRRRRGTPH